MKASALPETAETAGGVKKDNSPKEESALITITRPYLPGWDKENSGNDYDFKKSSKPRMKDGFEGVGEASAEP